MDSALLGTCLGLGGVRLGMGLAEQKPNASTSSLRAASSRELLKGSDYRNMRVLGSNSYCRYGVTWWVRAKARGAWTVRDQ